MADYTSLIIVLILLAAVYLYDRKNFKKEAALVYLRRTKKGISFINKFSEKHKSFFKAYSDIGIIVTFGLLGVWYLLKTDRTRSKKMLLIETLLAFSILLALFGFILQTLNIIYLILTILFGASGFIISFLLGLTYDFIFIPTSEDVEAPLQLVLPVQIEGAPVFYVPLDLWLICIFVILVAHEFSHAFVARAQGIDVKSLGYGFMAFLPVGFAEPDEKQVKKADSLTKTRIYGAGSFANFLVAILAIPILIATMFIYSGYTESTGVEYGSTLDGMPADGVLPEEGVLTSIEGNDTKDVYTMMTLMDSYSPGDEISVGVDNRTYLLKLGENPNNESKAFMGISEISQSESYKIKGFFGELIASALKYIVTLLNFIFGLNIGIALVNILPLKPLDGGLMFEEVLKKTGLKSRKRIAYFVAMSMILILLFNIIGPSIIEPGFLSYLL